MTEDKIVKYYKDLNYPIVEKEYDHSYDLNFRVDHTLSIALLSENPPKRKKILDLGCGSGVLLDRLREKFPNNEFIGCDYSTNVLKYTLKKGFKTKVCDFSERLPFKTNKIDIAITNCVIAHIFDTGFFLAEVRRILKLGGIFILTTPNFNSIRDMFRYIILGKTPTEIDHEHIRLFNPKLLERKLNDAGFRVSAWKCFAPIIPKVFANKIGIKKHWITIPIFKTLLSHQLVVKARK